MRVEDLYERLARLEERFTGTLGVAAGSLNGTADDVAWHADASFPAASVIKVPILYACLRQVDAGRLDLGRRIVLNADDRVPGSGVLRDLDPGLALTLRDLLTLMIIVSDNTATNMVIDALGGVDPVNAELGRLGLGGTRLVGKLMLPKDRQSEAQRRGEMNRTTPADMLRLIRIILRGEGLSPAAAATARAILRRQHYTDSLTRELPWPPSEPDAPWEIGAKSGSITGVRNQAGWLAADGNGFAFAVFTQGCADRRFFSENEGNRVVAHAVRLLFDYFMGE